MALLQSTCAARGAACTLPPSWILPLMRIARMAAFRSKGGKSTLVGRLDVLVSLCG